MTLQFQLTGVMGNRSGTAIEVFAFAAFIAATIFIVLSVLTYVSNECINGTPFLPAIFSCFETQR